VTEGETADPSATLGMTKERAVLHLGMPESGTWSNVFLLFMYVRRARRKAVPS
jgi:hypothetical protein